MLFGGIVAVIAIVAAVAVVAIVAIVAIIAVVPADAVALFAPVTVALGRRYPLAVVATTVLAVAATLVPS